MLSRSKIIEFFQFTFVDLQNTQLLQAAEEHNSEFVVVWDVVPRLRLGEHHDGEDGVCLFWDC